MQKILIIGGNGAGKSTFAKRLADITDLPLRHLDKLYWTDGWQPRDSEEFKSLLQLELEKPKWIIDGNMKKTLSHRLKYCDTVIYFDFPSLTCFFGALKRIIKNRGKTRDDMGENCPEKFDKRTLKFLFGTLKFNKKNRALFYETVSKAPNAKLIVFKNRRQAEVFLNSLKTAKNNGENV